MRAHDRRDRSRPNAGRGLQPRPKRLLASITFETLNVKTGLQTPSCLDIPYRLNLRTDLLGINVGLTIEPLAQPTRLTIYSPF